MIILLTFDNALFCECALCVLDTFQLNSNDPDMKS
jgi:hypothetical protein